MLTSCAEYFVPILELLLQLTTFAKYVPVAELYADTALAVYRVMVYYNHIAVFVWVNHSGRSTLLSYSL